MFRHLRKTFPPSSVRKVPSPRRCWFRLSLEPLEDRQLLSTIAVHAGDDLQSILHKVASPGDTLVLDAGARFGPITLPNLGSDQWITIESSAMDRLPSPGQRVGPADAAYMPKIITKGPAGPALRTEQGAHNYRFAGIEFLPDTATTFVYDLIDLGDGSTAQSSLDQVPYNLMFDQCYIHAWPGQDLKRGIALNSAETSIINSYLADFKSVDQDSQAIAGWNGPGPYSIDNNYVEAAGENILFGGDIAYISDLVPSNIEILDNEFYKPLSWKPDDPSYAGTPWTVKNLLELKNARQVLIEGNLLQNNWRESQDGYAILFTVRDKNGSMPWATVEDVKFQNNVLAHVAAGFNILGIDNGTTAQTQHIIIRNNLIEDISSVWGSNGNLLQILNGANDIIFDHNTAFPTHSVITTDGAPSTGLVYTNNITTYGSYGIVGTNTQEGNQTLGYYFADAVVVGNVLAGQSKNAVRYPMGNFFPATLDAVGFVDLAGGDYRLADSSPYKNSGTDDEDPGADIDAILAAMTSITVPQGPTGLTATAVSSSQINLAWNAVAGAMAYEIERSPDGSSHWEQIGVTAGSRVTFQDLGLMADTTWFYRVRATNIAGRSDYSDQARAATFTGGGAGSLLLTGMPTALSAGTPATFTVTVTDALGTIAAGYLGTVHFSSSDSKASLPADYTFTPGDRGVHTFAVTFKTAGTLSLTATDTRTSGISGTKTGIAVNPAAASTLRVTGFPSLTTAGTENVFTITAIDAYGNTVTGYRGTVHFSSSDSRAILPINYTFTAADNGVHSFSAILKIAGTQSLAAADTVTGGLAATQAGIVVSPAAAATFLVAGFPSSAVAGVAYSFTVTAKDPFGNTATGYRGTVYFSTSDRWAVLPGEYTFTAADNGVRSFKASLKTVGIQWFSATDTLSGVITGMQAQIAVTPGGGGGAAPPPPQNGLAPGLFLKEAIMAFADAQTPPGQRSRSSPAGWL
jgi:hypothetical protein